MLTPDIFCPRFEDKSGVRSDCYPHRCFFGGVLLDTEKELRKNEKTLAAINAVLLNRATADQPSYIIGT